MHSVHELQREVARRYAAYEWRRMGARSFEEAYGIYLHDVRARWAGRTYFRQTDISLSHSLTLSLSLARARARTAGCSAHISRCGGVSPRSLGEAKICGSLYTL